jgi:hypothetical protein
MASYAGRPLEYDELGALLDAPVLAVEDFGESGDRFAYLNPEHAAQAGAALEDLVPQTIWTLLRGLPAGSGLRIDPGTEQELVFAAEEVDGILGVQQRGEASVLSRRARAELGSAWVLYPRTAEGQPLPTSQDAEGRRVAFAWRDEAAARASLQPGQTIAQLPLEALIRGNNDVTVIVDPGLPSGVFIDAKLREELLATVDFFPRGYLAFVAELSGPVARSYAPALKTAAKQMRKLGIPVRGLWSVGYRLERARSQVLLVADVDEADWGAVVAQLAAALAQHPSGDDQPVSSLRFAQIPEAFHSMIAASRNAV